LYLTVIAGHKQRHRGLPFESSLKLLLASPLADSKWPLLYYTPERLFSVQARRVWIEPDLKPLEVSAPEQQAPPHPAPSSHKPLMPK
jgi:hypothetical protein